MLVNLRSVAQRADVILLFLIAFTVWELYDINAPLLRNHFSSIDLSAGNATLGVEEFGDIFVVSPNRSLGGETIWRLDGMMKAANLTGLELQVPSQPKFNHEDVLSAFTKQALEREKGREVAAYLRLAHLDIVRQIHAADYSSALILENDADWDVAIRDETLNIASAIRNLTYAETNDPWGENWDLLALGHCGGGKVESDEKLSAIIDDPTVGPVADYLAIYGPQRDRPENSRFVHYTQGCVCAYGYAISRRGAKKLYDFLSKPGGLLDMDIKAFCRDAQVDCWTVTPEIFHHQRWTGHVTTSGGDSHGALEEGEVSEKFTVNIQHSARCNAEQERSNGELIQCFPYGKAKEKYHTK